MSGPDRRGLDLDGLRRAFDAAFASPAEGKSVETDDFLALRVAGQAVAVRLAQVRGLLPGGKITPLPSHLEEVLGLAGIRGRCVPVYSAAALLGHARPSGAALWFVLCTAGKAELALAFDGFEGYLQVPRARVRGEVIDAGTGARTIVDIASLAKGLEARIKEKS